MCVKGCIAFSFSFVPRYFIAVNVQYDDTFFSFHTVTPGCVPSAIEKEQIFSVAYDYLPTIWFLRQNVYTSLSTKKYTPVRVCVCALLAYVIYMYTQWCIWKKKCAHYLY